MTQSDIPTQQVDYEKLWLMEKELNGKMSKLMETSERIIQKLKQDLSAEKQEKETYNIECKKLKKQVKQLTFEKEKMQTTIRRLKEDDSADIDSSDSRDGKKKDEKIRQLTNHYEALKKFCDSNLSLKDDTIEKLKSRIDDVMTKTRKMLRELKEKDAEIQKLKDSEGFYVRRMQAMKKDLEEIRRKDSGVNDSVDHPMEVECFEDMVNVKDTEVAGNPQGAKNSEGVAKEDSNVLTGSQSMDVDSVLEIASLKSEIDILRQAHFTTTREKDQQIAQLHSQYEMSTNVCRRLNEILIHVQSTGQMPNWYRF